MQITKIERQKRRTGRVNIFVDGEFAIGISSEALLQEGLRRGDEITDEKLRTIQAKENLLATRLSALSLLSHRQRSVNELRDRLRKKHFNDDDIRTVIDNLVGSGLLNDELFARSFLRDRLLTRPSGKRLLRQKLREFGVDREIIDGAIDEAFEETPELIRADEAARKYVRSRSGNITDPRVLQRRLSAFLARRGFSWDTIRPTVEEVLSDSSENGKNE